MDEIIFKKHETPPQYPHDEPCKNCGGKLYHRAIGCPDGKSGCLVMHYGWVCDTCGKAFA